MENIKRFQLSLHVAYDTQNLEKKEVIILNSLHIDRMQIYFRQPKFSGKD